MSEKKKGSFIGLLPLVIFLVVYFIMGIALTTPEKNGFDRFPLMIGIFIASAISLFLNSPVAEKKSFSEKVTMFCKGGGENTLILMVLIYMLAGAFYSVSIAMHARDSVTNLFLNILPARMVLPGLFIIGCVISFAMGTSMGTVSALMPVGVGLATKLGVPLPLVAGVVVGGAMFGDNLSFISDTTIAAATTLDVDMKSKFKSNVYMVIPAVIINIIMLAFVKINVQPGTQLGGEFNFINIIPFILIILLSLLGMHVLPAMTLSVLSGVIIGIMHGDFTFAESFGKVHEGMMWMQDMAVIAIFVGGLVEMMKYLGGIDWLLFMLSKNVKSRKGAELSMAFMAFLVDVATTNNTISIIACGPISKDICDEFDVHRERAAGILDIFSSVGNGISPHAGQLLTAGALAGIAPASIIGYSWYSILMGISSIIFILLGLGKVKGAKRANS